MLAGADIGSAAVTRSEPLDQLLGRLDGETGGIVAGIGGRPQQVATLMVAPGGSCAEVAVRGLNDQVRGRQQTFDDVLAQAFETRGTAVVHVHADGPDGGHVRAAAAVDHLAAVGIAQGPERVHAEVDVAAVPPLEQRTVGFLHRRGRVVERAEVPQDAAAGRVLGDDLLERAVVVMHAGDAAAAPHLPGEADDVPGPEERLDQAQRLGLEAVLLGRVQQTRR